MKVLFSIITLIIFSACASFQKFESTIQSESFSFRIPSSLEKQIKLLDRQKPTICTITINSADEKKVFQSYLGNQFNFIELVSKEANWFESACKQQIQCDVLVVSGHFGGRFFGSSGAHLPLTKLERQSCHTECDGILKNPKEVFLFGCNTTAGKRFDRRTPEEYAQVLIDDGFSRRQAEVIAAFRYSPIGRETKERMQMVFKNSRIYGFYSQAPSGRNIRPRLKKYFNSIPNGDYQKHLSQFPTKKENLLWTKAMKGQWIRSVNGLSHLENPVCILEGDQSIQKKFRWIERTLTDENTALNYIPNINEFMKNLRKLHGSDLSQWPTLLPNLVERIRQISHIKQRLSSVLRKPIAGMLLVQIDVLNFSRRIGWYDHNEYQKITRRLLGDLFRENLSVVQKDEICSMDIELDLTLSDLPSEKWNKQTITAIGCVKPTNIQVQLSLVRLLIDKNRWIRFATKGALRQINPTDTPVLLAMVANLKHRDSKIGYVTTRVLESISTTDIKVYEELVHSLKNLEPHGRKYVAWIFRAMKPKLLIVQKALIEALNDPNEHVRRAAVNALGSLKAKEEAVFLALIQSLKDKNRYVKAAAANSLGQLKLKDQRIIQALVDTLKTDPDYRARKSALYAIVKINPNSHKTHLILIDALSDPEKLVRFAAKDSLLYIKSKDKKFYQALVFLLKNGKSKEARVEAADLLTILLPKEKFIYLALAKSLHDPFPRVRALSALALTKINPKNQSVHQALANALSDSNALVYTYVREALQIIQPKDPETLKIIKEKDSKLYQELTQ